jgi:hypothetical protein
MLLRVKLWLGAAVAVLVAFAGAWVAGRREGRQDARADALRGDIKRHEAMNEADIGIGANDSDNIRWLRDFAERNKR